MILVSDANVLIDLGYVGGIHILPQLAEAEVLDLVLLECEHPSQPNLIEDVKAAGIKVITVEQDWIDGADEYSGEGVLSLEDRVNIFYARTFERTLLTGDMPIREVCTREGIDIRGSFWIVREAFERGVVPADELLRWLQVWPQKGRWLPKDELKKIEQLIRSR